MRYNKLGATDIDVSVICLGTMTYGEQNTEVEAHAQLDYAIDQGVNFIDTAELYAVPSNPHNNGKTEDYIGTWIKARSDRDKLVLATKVTGPSPNLTYISPNLGFSKERVMEACDRSLRRLQTGYIDLYQLHWPERKTNYFGKRAYVHDAADRWEDNFSEVLSTLEDLKRAGKIRHWGLSNETPWGVMRSQQVAATLGVSGAVSIQNPYNLLNRTFEVGNAEVAHRESIGLLAYSPLAFGRLSGKYERGTDRPQDRLNKYKQMGRYNSEQCISAIHAYQEIADMHDLSLTQLALAFVNTRPFLTANIIGATTMDQLKENIGTAEITLSDEVLQAIEQVQESSPNPAP